jgi:TonB family protein
MSSVATAYDDKSTNGERRGSRRESLKRVVLVFFGENNWGKLTDVSESGMSFEFAQEPALRQRMGFRFETMGCVVAHLGGELIHKSFEVAGKVLWTRQFERAAGAQFVDLTERSREQIQSLLTLDATNGTETLGDPPQSEAMVRNREQAESLRSLVEVPGEGEGEGAWLDAEEESIVEPDGVEPGRRSKSELAERISEAVTSCASNEPDDELGQTESLSRRRSGILRIGLALTGGCIVVMASVAVARRIPAPWTRRTEAVLQLQNFPGDKGQTAAPKSHAAATDPQSFLVEVSDSNHPTWLLWFVHNDSRDMPKPVARRSATDFSSSEAGRKGPRQEHFSPATSRRRFQDSRPIAQMSHPKTKALAAPLSLDQAPVLPDVVAIPKMDPAAGLVLNGSIPGAEVRSPVLGGQVQPARLLKAAPPIYPALAKARHVGGEVTLDALIDAGGNVTKVRAISGPVDLQQAAIEAVRLWKYDPARLDGRPVAMHLNVVVKFNVK